jgi:threonylcarbamoyladenosine tRNA methylthiotransferase MtaB
MKVWLRTFGCRANQADTEALRGMLVAAGHTIADEPDDADVAVFNSCAVTARAEADLRAGVRRAARANPHVRSVIMGCASARDERGALRSLPTVDALVAGGDLEAIAGVLDLDPRLALSRLAAQQGVRALLRVQDGCDEHCTFCATTLARGSSRSRDPRELEREVRALAEHHAEIVITGVHIGHYGRDIGTTLGELMERLVVAVPDVRFRLTSIEATEVCDRLRGLWRDARDRLVPHLHAPLQSGSDRVLKRMGRHWYTARRYRQSIQSLAAAAPYFAFGADVITGFPGETEDDHCATLALVRELPFTYLHVFPFSERPGTPASRLGERVASAVAARRAADLRAIADASASRYCASRAGGPADVVVIASHGRRQGLTDDYLTVAIADETLPRGTRFMAVLQRRGGELVAVGDGAAWTARGVES